MDTIKFKGKEYPCRTFEMKGDCEEVSDSHLVALISVESLFEAMDWEGEDSELDNKIYYYVPDKEITLPAETICAECLDLPFKFVEEFE